MAPRESKKLADGQFFVLAGVPGFGPGIIGPEPIALPLGYTPIMGENLNNKETNLVRDQLLP